MMKQKYIISTIVGISLLSATVTASTVHGATTSTNVIDYNKLASETQSQISTLTSVDQQAGDALNKAKETAKLTDTYNQLEASRADVKNLLDQYSKLQPTYQQLPTQISDLKAKLNNQLTLVNGAIKANDYQDVAADKNQAVKDVTALTQDQVKDLSLYVTGLVNPIRQQAGLKLYKVTDDAIQKQMQYEKLFTSGNLTADQTNQLSQFNNDFKDHLAELKVSSLANMNDIKASLYKLIAANLSQITADQNDNLFYGVLLYQLPDTYVVRVYVGETNGQDLYTDQTASLTKQLADAQTQLTKIEAFRNSLKDAKQKFNDLNTQYNVAQNYVNNAAQYKSELDKQIQDAKIRVKAFQNLAVYAAVQPTPAKPIIKKVVKTLKTKQAAVTKTSLKKLVTKASSQLKSRKYKKANNSVKKSFNKVLNATKKLLKKKKISTASLTSAFKKLTVAIKSVSK